MKRQTDGERQRIWHDRSYWLLDALGNYTLFNVG